MPHPANSIVTLACLVFWSGAAVGAQQTVGAVVVRVRSGAAPIASAEVGAADVHVETDARGEARLELPAGDCELSVRRDGFMPATVRVAIAAGGTTEVVVQLRQARFEDTVTVVAATRSGRMIEDQAIRVEALPQEEIEENATLAPGNLTTLLNEIGGLRVQTVSAGLGGANLRLGGLPGRYTTILVDELPLYGGGADAFALLQVPPLDLAQVEVLKGAASAFYGGGGLGGLVNLVSRRPDGEPEVSVSQSLHGATDAVGFVPGQLGGGWGYTLLGSVDRQVERDLDDDGWAELPGYRRAVLRPRLFWDDHAGHSLFATVGGIVEHRRGGTVDGAALPDGSAFRERLETHRFDGGVVGRFVVGGDRLVSLHASYTRARRDRRLGQVDERDVRNRGVAELTLAGSGGGHSWVVGAALDSRSDRFAERPDLDATSTAPALFVQDELSPTPRLSLAASVRADFDRRYGTFIDPRLSALVRPGGGWSLRLSAGGGYAAPTPVLDATEAVGVSRLLPLGELEAERAWSASFDAGWSRGAFEVNTTLFASRLRGALQLRGATAEPGRFELVNAASPTEVYGSQLFARYHRGAWQLIASHTFLDATEADPLGPGRRTTPLTPRHAGELAVLYEEESRGRLGVEVSYTGRQALEDDPYRRSGTRYLEVSALGELRLGEAHLFLNATNLTDVHQTGFDPLLLPQRAADGRWTTDVWAPLEGRSLIAGVRFEL